MYNFPSLQEGMADNQAVMRFLTCDEPVMISCEEEEQTPLLYLAAWHSRDCATAQISSTETGLGFRVSFSQSLLCKPEPVVLPCSLLD